MTLTEIRTPAPSGGRRRVSWHHIRITEGCWLWTGPVHKGYGKASGTTARLALGRTIAANLELDHLCLRPLCVNPDHLEPVTRDENIRRRYALYTNCKSGHRFTRANTYIRPSGHRDCRKCMRVRRAKYRRTHQIGAAA